MSGPRQGLGIAAKGRHSQSHGPGNTRKKGGLETSNLKARLGTMPGMTKEDTTLSRVQLSQSLSGVWFHGTQKRVWLWQRDFPSSSFVPFNPSTTT